MRTESRSRGGWWRRLRRSRTRRRPKRTRLRVTSKIFKSTLLVSLILISNDGRSVPLSADLEEYEHAAHSRIRLGDWGWSSWNLYEKNLLVKFLPDRKQPCHESVLSWITRRHNETCPDSDSSSHSTFVKWWRLTHYYIDHTAIKGQTTAGSHQARQQQMEERWGIWLKESKREGTLFKYLTDMAQSHNNR